VPAGSGRIKLDYDGVDLIELDAVRVGPGTARTFEAGPDGLELLIFGAHVDGDVEQVSGFWTRWRGAPAMRLEDGRRLTG
jgi:hypothetical protein